MWGFRLAPVTADGLNRFYELCSLQATAIKTQFIIFGARVKLARTFTIFSYSFNSLLIDFDKSKVPH